MRWTSAVWALLFVVSAHAAPAELSDDGARFGTPGSPNALGVAGGTNANAISNAPLPAGTAGSVVTGAMAAAANGNAPSGVSPGNSGPERSSLLNRIGEVSSRSIGQVGSKIGEVGSKIGEVGSQVGAGATALVDKAFELLGVPYRRGGTNEQTGFDCSGLVRSIYEQAAGLLLPRSAAQQAAATERIEKKDLKPGDLVFFNTMRRAFSHVGIYIGNGKFIHAPRPGEDVRVEDLGLAYWAKRFDGARRVPEGQPSAMAPTQP